ncbi:MAG: hypothetical protein ACRD63_06495, partial [Pyrinomonadaceae bacterium]
FCIANRIWCTSTSGVTRTSPGGCRAVDHANRQLENMCGQRGQRRDHSDQSSSQMRWTDREGLARGTLLQHDELVTQQEVKSHRIQVVRIPFLPE